MQRWLNRHNLPLVFSLLLLCSPSAQAGGESPPAGDASAAASTEQPTAPQNNKLIKPLAPFKAYYQAQFDLGINVGGEAVRQLKALPDNQWQLSMNATAMVASIDESSRFEFTSDQSIKPQHYNYLRKVLGKKKHRQLDFDWQKATVNSIYNKDKHSFALEPQTLDTISYQIQLWHDVKAGLKTMNYRVADDGQIEPYRYNVVGEERVETPAGDFNAIKVARDRGEGSQRQTFIWFAQEHDHVIVKLEQIEVDGKRYTLLLERLETP
ncbi:MAG: DUF3108 domain-containing protein [Motiliproteus sp.]